MLTREQFEEIVEGGRPTVYVGGGVTFILVLTFIFATGFGLGWLIGGM